jgi:hypothetical protein
LAAWASRPEGARNHGCSGRPACWLTRPRIRCGADLAR